MSIVVFVVVIIVVVINVIVILVSVGSTILTLFHFFPPFFFLFVVAIFCFCFFFLLNCSLNYFIAVVRYVRLSVRLQDFVFFGLFQIFFCSFYYCFQHLHQYLTFHAVNANRVQIVLFVTLSVRYRLFKAFFFFFLSQSLLLLVLFNY